MMKQRLLRPSLWPLLRGTDRNGPRPGSICYAGGRRSMLLIGVAFAVLALGLFVYATDRDLQRSAWIPNAIAVRDLRTFGTMGGWLPAFAHACGFSLLSAAFAPVARVPSYGTCVCWALIDVIFEIGQHPAVQHGLAAAIRTCFGESAIPRVFAFYFSRGVFDVSDIAAAIGGATAAALFLRQIHPIAGETS